MFECICVLLLHGKGTTDLGNALLDFKLYFYWETSYYWTLSYTWTGWKTTIK